MYDQQNLLEKALRRAAGDPAFIPEFYGTLLDSEVFVVGHTDLGPQERDVVVVAKTGSNVHIQHGVGPNGADMIPFFSSLSALQAYLTEEASYMRFDVRVLFEMTLGADLFLNPASEHSKAFTAFEIDDLLRHGMPMRGKREVVQEDTPVLLGQPQNYPHDITETLFRFFTTEPRVKAAYLVLMHRPDHDEKPILCVGIECDPAHYDDICSAAGVAVSALLSEDRPLNFCLVDPQQESGPGDYMLKETQPFYRSAPPSGQQPAATGRRSFGRRTSAPTA